MAMEGGSKLEEHGAELRVQDNLKLMENKKFLRCLEKFRNNKKNREHFFDADPTEIQERVRFSDTLVKINRKGKRQKRALVITNLAIYNFKPNSYSSFQRRINTAHLDKIICLQDSTEFVLCMWEYSYDYDYRFDGMLEVCGMLAVVVDQGMKCVRAGSSSTHPYTHFPCAEQAGRDHCHHPGLLRRAHGERTPGGA